MFHTELISSDKRVLEDFKNTLSWLRQDCLKVSQKELASMLQYKTPQFVSNWERGVCLPSPKALIFILSKVTNLTKQQKRAVYWKLYKAKIAQAKLGAHREVFSKPFKGRRAGKESYLVAGIK